ncbi:hypothetical protein CDAR_79701 [Caerostris darwini]|uniref:Uncharacterized protein n=1 Tax=Caerostris darwini TaxID=1538125 RepID=A0AAV4V8U4_9ARAC|nr:hypothetical protein CDAR_79701 [Caerostris darwini]
MSLNLRKCSDSVRKRSNSLPAVNSIFENKAVVKFRRNLSDSESRSSLESINFSKDRKKYSVFETMDDGGKLTPRSFEDTFASKGKIFDKIANTTCPGT